MLRKLLSLGSFFVRPSFATGLGSTLRVSAVMHANGYEGVANCRRSEKRKPARQ